MARKRHKIQGQNKVDIQMTPMLDMIFQLLVFFILTWKPVTEEGQLLVEMSSVVGGSSAAPTEMIERDPLEELPVPIVLRAGTDGHFTSNGMTLGERSFSNLADLKGALQQLAGDSPEEVKIQLNADTGLKYEHVVDVISVVSQVGIKVISFGAP